MLEMARDNVLVSIRAMETNTDDTEAADQGGHSGLGGIYIYGL